MRIDNSPGGEKKHNITKHEEWIEYERVTNRMFDIS